MTHVTQVTRFKPFHVPPPMGSYTTLPKLFWFLQGYLNMEQLTKTLMDLLGYYRTAQVGQRSG